MQNENIYPTNQDKILFILSLMTDGVPGKWMKHWMTQIITKWWTMPSYKNINNELETQFLNPNLEQLE